jgi:hypothetical protein
MAEDLSGSKAYLFCSLPDLLLPGLDFKAGSPGKLATDQQLPEGSIRDGARGGGGAGTEGTKQSPWGPWYTSVQYSPPDVCWWPGQERNTYEQS